MPDKSLILHWDMFEIEDGKLEDASEKDNEGLLRGSPQLIPDDVFGGCLSFNDADRRGDHIVAANIGLAGPNQAHTVEAWVYVADYPKGRSWLLVLGQYGEGAHSWLLTPQGSFQLGVWNGAYFGPQVPKKVWTHIALAYDGKLLSCYVNGVAQGNPQPARFNIIKGDLAVALGAPGELDFSGKIASVRVYNRALSGEEINLDMVDDQTAMAAFRRTHPLDFNLYDDDDQQALYIADDPAGRDLRLEVSNTSRQAIEFVKPDSDAASADNCHLELRFRPGILSAASLSRIAVAESDWRLARSQANGAGVSLYLLNAKGATVAPSGRINLTLRHVGADSGDGARGTRVELKYSRIKYPNDTSLIEGSRIRHLSVVNQRGRKNIPLHAGFLGPNIVLNDGASSVDLVLRLTNTLRDDSIQWTPAGAGASKLIVAFDAQGQGENKEWALGTSADVAGVSIECAGWTIAKNEQGASPEWVLTHSQKTSLAPGEFILLKLRGVKSSLPTGQANVYIRYENIPGYWDGQFVCVVEKAPLFYAQNRVGVGTANPQRPLSVRGAGRSEELLAFEDLSGETKWHINQKWGGTNRGLNFAETGVADGRLFIKAGGEIGIGTVDPKAKLHVVQGAIMPEKGNTEAAGILFPKDPGGGSNDAAWIRYYARSGEATTLEIGVSNDPDDNIALVPSGGVGVGTVNPPAGIKMAVSAAGNHLQLRREAAEKTGGKILFLELFQDDRSSAAVPEVYPSIRFHHSYRHWSRIEARSDGIHFKEGNLAGDGYTNVFAANGTFTGNVSFGAANNHGFIRPVGTIDLPQETYRSASAGTHQRWQHVVTGPCIFGVNGGVLGTLAGGEKVALYWNSEGNVRVRGYIAAQVKYFRIDHPTKKDHQLEHSCLEGPEIGVYYRGEARLHDGEATIQLPEYFEALTRKEGRTVLLTAKGKKPFRLSYEEIRDGRFKVYGARTDGEFSWEVKAVRADVENLTVEAPRPGA